MIEVRRQVTAAACLIFGVTDLFFLNSVVFPRVLRRTSAHELLPMLAAPAAPAAVRLAPAPAPVAEPVPAVEPAAVAQPAPIAKITPAPKIEQIEPIEQTPPRAPARVAAAPAFIFFASAGRRLDHVGRDAVDRMVATLDQNPNATLLVEGHADAIGEADFNNRLSRQRAASVLAYLKQRGVASLRVTIRSYGSTRPVATGHDTEALQRNRRVEITVRGGS